MLIRHDGFTLGREVEAEMPFRFNLLIGLALVICFFGGFCQLGFAMFFGEVLNFYSPDTKFIVQVALFSSSAIFLIAFTLIYIFLWRHGR